MRTLFVIVNLAMAVLMLIAASLQLNDPDPVRWIAIYLSAAVACIVAWRTRRGFWLAVVVGGAALIWAGVLSPILPELRLDDLARTMKAENPRIEVSRELLGLTIVAVWMAVLVAVYRRPSRPG